VNSNTPDPKPDPSPSAPEEGELAQTEKTGAETRASAKELAHPWLLLSLAGLLAGVLAAALGEEFHDFFQPELKPQILQGNRMMAPTFETNVAATLKNGALDNGELGAVLGLALGLAGGLIRRSVRAAITAGLVGLVIGAALGIAIPFVLFPLFYAAKKFTETTEPDLLVSLAIHAGIWASLGAAGGLAFALGLGGLGRLGHAVIGGFLGAVVGTLVYEVVGAVAFPLSGSADPIAQTWEPRVLSRLLIPLVASLAIGLLVLAPGKTSEQ